MKPVRRYGGTAQAPTPLPYTESPGSMTAQPIVLALTGASGAPYGVRLLEVLARQGAPVWLIVSEHGLRLLREECNIKSLDGLKEATGGDWSSVVLFPDDDRGAKPASGSQRTGGMVVCPCSMATVAAIAGGTSRSLVERAADVTLKERRRLILVPRQRERFEEVATLLSRGGVPYCRRSEMTTPLRCPVTLVDAGTPAWQRSEQVSASAS